MELAWLLAFRSERRTEAGANSLIQTRGATYAVFDKMPPLSTRLRSLKLR
jgi:hypothetical protein